MRGRSKGPAALEVMADLWALTHALESRSKWMKRVYGVSGPQFLLVRLLGMNHGCSPSEAARLLSLHAGTVTHLVAGLEALGMVRRSDDRRDGRRVELTLTERGRRLTRINAGTVQRAVERALDRARPGEAVRATAFIRKLAAELTPPVAGRNSGVRGWEGVDAGPLGRRKTEGRSSLRPARVGTGRRRRHLS